MLYLVWIAFWYLLLMERNIHVVDADIQVGPLNTVGTVGHTAHLNCVTDQRSCVGVTWSIIFESGDVARAVFTDGEVNSIYRTVYNVSSLSTGSCQLTINNVQLSDAVVFVCGHRFDTKVSAFSVIESQPVIQTNITPSRSVVDGDQVNVSCSLSFKSPVEVSLSMTQNGQFIEGSKVEQLPSSSNRIHTSVILTARQPQFGPFQCHLVLTQTKRSGGWAENSLEMQSEVLQSVTVHYPVRLHMPHHTPLSEGHLVGLKCMAHGHPPPTYQWLVFPENITVSSDAVLFCNASVNNATYKCVASNVINGKTYSMLSERFHSNEEVCTPVTSFSHGLVAVICCGIVVFIIVGFVFLIVRKYQQRASSTTEAKKESVGILMKSVPHSVPSSQPSSQPSCQPLPSSSSSSAFQRNPSYIPAPSTVPTVPHNMPSNRNTSYNIDKFCSSSCGLSTAIRGPGELTSDANGRESSEVTYAELAAPAKPPRAPTSVSYTIYAPIATA